MRDAVMAQARHEASKSVPMGQPVDPPPMGQPVDPPPMGQPVVADAPLARDAAATAAERRVAVDAARGNPRAQAALQERTDDPALAQALENSLHDF